MLFLVSASALFGKDCRRLVGELLVGRRSDFFLNCRSESYIRLLKPKDLPAVDGEEKLLSLCVCVCLRSD